MDLDAGVQPCLDEGRGRQHCLDSGTVAQLDGHRAAGPLGAVLPLDDVVNLDYLWWTGELDAVLGEDRHEALTERFELLL